MEYVERRVGFSTESDEEDTAAEKEGKLRRRDTPHHLKNKRTTAPTMGSGTETVSAEDKVRAILQNIHQNSDQTDSTPHVRVRCCVGVLCMPCIATVGDGWGDK